MKWLPPQQPGYGPWIEFTGTPGACPVDPNTMLEYLGTNERRNEQFLSSPTEADGWAWLNCAAYCVKLPEIKLDADARDAVSNLNGGKLTGNHYYRVEVKKPISDEVEPYTAECADIIEALDMTFNEGEAFKALWRLAASRQGRGKPGNKAQYDADKIAHYGSRVKAQEAAK